MKRYRTARTILFLCTAGLLVLLPCIIWFSCGDTVTTIWTGAVCALLFILFLLAFASTERYLQDMVQSLSDLVETITALRDEPVFSDAEDTVLSKLQSQVTKLTDILLSQKEKALKQEENMKALISDIAHQIKTPVAVLQLYSEFLQDSSITEKERAEYLQATVHSLKRLSFLTESMIKMSRLESGIITLHPEPHSLNETLLEAVMQVRTSAAAKSIQIDFAEPDGAVTLLHDRRWTAEAVYNLLDNAVKYTPPDGRIGITLKKYEMFARVDVEDNGTGIRQDELEKIFRRFYRGSAAESEDGVGIGLYLTRKIINLHGGYIKASPLRQGSRFSLFLPL